MKKYYIYILLFILILPAFAFLIRPGYFNMHDDLQVMRVLEMQKCLSDGQIPCRWSPDMAYGFGQAMFNFYSAFPYYLGGFLKVVTPLTFLATVKMLFLASFVVAALGMFLLAREFWGNWGGILAAVVYTYAPYHFVDVYVRGAMAEAFALAFLPFVWWSLYLLIKTPNFRNIAINSILLAILFTTHNISTLMYAPFTLLWVVFLIIYIGGRKSFKAVIVSGFFALGLSAFFLLPAISEQRLIQTQFLTTEYSNFHAHFVTLRQLFLERIWDDGPSIFGPNDRMPFQIGWPQWWLVFALLPIGLALYKKKRMYSILLTGLLGLAGISSFLTHSKSLFIWESIPIMAFIQFPWRFLGLVIFFLSFAAGGLAVANFKYRKVLITFIIFVTIALNWKYTKPVHYSEKVKDSEKLTGVAFELQQKSAILDYLPKTAEMAPQGLAPASPNFVSGSGVVTGFEKYSNRFNFEAEVYQDSQIEVPVMYFPGWIVLENNQSLPIKIHGKWGLISIELAQGKHSIEGRFIDTPVRSLANALTLISAVILATGVLFYNSIQENRGLSVRR